MRHSQKFINSYQFIPLPEKKRWYLESAEEEVFTGKLEYVLKTETPLFIPNTSNDHTFSPIKQKNEEGQWEEQPEDHLSYDFFSYTNLKKGQFYDEKWKMPVIPGSEVRGMFRNVYETLTGSCLSAIQASTEKLSKRTMEYYNPYLLKFENDRLWIGNAKCYSLAIDKQIVRPEGTRVTFQKMAKTFNKVDNIDCGTRVGYIINGNRNTPKDQKKNYHIFEWKLRNDPEVIGTNEIWRFKEVLLSYEKQGTMAYGEYKSALETFLENREEGSCFPVYASKVENEYYLAPACITRESYKNTVQDMIGDFSPCVSKEKLCPACQLFGMIATENTQSMTSKLRFSDLHIVNPTVVTKEDLKKCYTDVITLPTLGQPKISNTEFYLKHEPNATLQTFDYYIKGEQVIPYTPQIAGRKFYWHQQITEVPKGEKRTQLNKTIRAIQPKTEFQGTVYFDKITKKQLKQLVWMLHLSVNEPGKGYKLGTGKPLGLGSVTVRLKEEGCSLRTVTLQNGKIVYDMSQKPLEGIYQYSYEEVEFLQEVKNEFLFLADLYVTDGWTVSYPYINPNEVEDKGYEWYEANHSHNSPSGNSPKKRNHMVTLEHLKGFEEVNKNEYQISDFALPVCPGTGGPRCLWIAKYNLHKSQEEKLKDLLPEKTKIDTRKVDTWIIPADISSFAMDYTIIALPSGTKNYIIEEAKKYFKEVYVALKINSKFDNEWEKK